MPVATVGVDFFRVDRSTTTKRLLVVAAILVSIGATSIGAHLIRRLGPSVARLLSLGGGLMVAFGLIVGFGAMAMLVFENVYVLLREDGVLCHDNGAETIIPWAELERVTREGETGFLVLQRVDAPPFRWFAGENADELRRRIDEAKRKALHGLFRSNPPPASL